tara:strand:- start:34038 stop:34466 length:429 start_codon:yes stop_codon:yes gene_type:complete
MQLSGKCRISNKWLNGAVDKDSFDFENKGKIGVGRLNWSDVVKGKNGADNSFSSTTKKFICFGANIDFIEQNLGQWLEIVGNLKGEQFTNDKGEVVKYDQIVVNEVKLSEKKIDSHSSSKSNGFAPESNRDEDDLDSDEIPF